MRVHNPADGVGEGCGHCAIVKWLLRARVSLIVRLSVRLSVRR